MQFLQALIIICIIALHWETVTGVIKEELSFYGFDNSNKKAPKRRRLRWLGDKLRKEEAVFPDETGFQPIRINCGATEEFTDTSGQLWQSDSYFSGGRILFLPFLSIRGTKDKELYQSLRRSLIEPTVAYDIAIPNGDYAITLFFSENIHDNSGKRKFNVNVEDLLVFESLDIYEEAGGQFTPVKKTLKTTVSDGTLSIHLEAVIGNAMISAFEVASISGPSPATDAPATGAPTTLPPTTAIPISDVIILKLIYVPTNTEVFDLYDGATIYLGDLGLSDAQFNVKAHKVGDAVKSVFFVESRQAEGAEPFSYCGDSKGDYFVCDEITVGTPHSVTVNPYPEFHLSGVPFPDVSVTFTILDGKSPPVAAPVVPPTATPRAAPIETSPVIEGTTTNAPVDFETVPALDVIILKLIYAPTNAEVFDLFDGAIVYLEDLGLPDAQFNVKAHNIRDEVKSVFFVESRRTEGAEPLSYCGDNRGDYYACDAFTVGSPHTVTARPYPEIHRMGIPFPDVSVTFTIVNGKAPPASSPVVPPVTTPIASAAPITTPVTSPVAPSENFPGVLINCGGSQYTDVYGRTWEADEHYEGGRTYALEYNISNTQDDYLYSTERYSADTDGFKYSFDLPVGNYDVILHFAETLFQSPGRRVFDVKINNRTAFPNVDIMVLTAGEMSKAVTLETTEVVSDEVLLIEFVPTGTNVPKINGIEIELVAPHLAHAVANGPYIAIDTDGDGFALVPVDGTPSHTHEIGVRLVEWTWKIGNDVVGKGETPMLNLPVGEHVVTLFVKDGLGSESTESTTISVLSSKFPAIVSLSPSKGSITGNETLIISGSGFNYAAEETIVKVGESRFSGSDIVVLDQTTITLQTPVAIVATPVLVSVITPVGTSNVVEFTYINGATIDFIQRKITDIYSPTTLEFGPDLKLYVGTSAGLLFRFTLDDNFNVVESLSSSVIADLPGGSRSILGITSDPMDTSATPKLYVAHSFTFHGETKSSSGEAINGKISVVSGSNLDMIEDVITGLPVSDHDHAVNGIEFGNEGQLYIQIGGSTNAGVPGRLTTNRIQKEGVLSAATLVAHNITGANFSGKLTYDADDDGNLNPGYDVEVFAHGNRNPYDLVLHSNGYLYGTDNGPNVNYGDISSSCSSQLPEIQQGDKINLLEKGLYYGHPNRKRGETDPRQCVWHSTYEESDDEYTAPIAAVPSSAVGIIEFQTDHFDGQLRGDLIYCKYKKSLYRVILTEDGRGVIPQSIPPIKLVGNNCLDVTQAPDGRLVDARYLTGALFYYKPNEPSTSAMKVKGVFPRRGSVAGGSNLHIFGVNFGSSNNSSTLYVTVGGSQCPVVSNTSTKIVCTLPEGSGTVDVVVSTASETSTFKAGYRYITGRPKAAES